MAKVCIPKENIDSFKRAIKKQDIKMSDLFNMSTEQLTKKLKPYAGKNTKDVVLLFEQKRILKNKLLGMKNAVSKIGEIGRYDPTKKAEIKKALDEFKAQQRERVLSPKETENFYNALADKMLGIHVTKAEAKNFSILENKANKLESKIDINKTPEDAPIWREFASAKHLAVKYHTQLMEGNGDIRTLLKSFGSDTKQNFKEDKLIATGKLMVQVLNFISDLSITMKATWDNSFMGRQGMNVLKTHPSKWYPSAMKSNKDFIDTLRGQDAEAGLMIDVYSRRGFLSGEYQTAKIIPKSEEPIATRIPERLPLIGNLFKGADIAFIGNAIRVRMDLFDMFKKKALENGVKWDKAQIEDIGTLINSLTARGGLEGNVGGVLKVVLWAPKMLKASWDVRTAHTLGIGLKTKFARDEAYMNMAKIIGTDAMIMTLANAIKPGSAETDPRSTKFGTIQVGNTAFDYTGGAKSLAVIAAQMVTGERKTTGNKTITELGSGFGQQTRFDAIINFLTGKTKPFLNVLIQVLRGRTYENKKPTAGSVARGLFVPIVTDNAIQLKDDSSVSAVAGVMLDFLGINASTYPRSSTNFDLNPSDEMKEFKVKVGEEDFKKANEEYNKQVSLMLGKLDINSKYQVLSNDDKKRVIKSKKAKIKADIFRSYGFRKKRERPDRTPRI